MPVIIPTEEQQQSVLGTLNTKNGVMAATCVNQCVGCSCICRCQCRAIEDQGFTW